MAIFSPRFSFVCVCVCCSVVVSVPFPDLCEMGEKRQPRFVFRCVIGGLQQASDCHCFVLHSVSSGKAVYDILRLLL